MAAYSWPASLPQSPQKGFSETGGVLVLRTPMDAGPAKMRTRGQKPQVLNLAFLMTSSQVEILESFVKNTIKGVYRFNFTHPRTFTAVETRIVPTGGGDLYNLTYVAPGYWNVSLQFEVLP